MRDGKEAEEERKEQRKEQKKIEEQNWNFCVRFSRLWREVTEIWGYILHKNS